MRWKLVKQAYLLRRGYLFLDIDFEKPLNKSVLYTRPFKPVVSRFITKFIVYMTICIGRHFFLILEVSEDYSS